MKTIRRLPDSELEVMQALWTCDVPANRTEIAAKMHEQTDRPEPLAQTTLLTLLSRLEQKGFIRIEKQGKASVYMPMVAQEEYNRSQSRSFVDKLFGGNMKAFANALSDGGLTEDELAELKHFLEEQ